MDEANLSLITWNDTMTAQGRLVQGIRECIVNTSHADDSVRSALEVCHPKSVYVQNEHKKFFGYVCEPKPAVLVMLNLTGTGFVTHIFSRSLNLTLNPSLGGHEVNSTVTTVTCMFDLLAESINYSMGDITSYSSEKYEK